MKNGSHNLSIHKLRLLFSPFHTAISQKLLCSISPHNPLEHVLSLYILPYAGTAIPDLSATLHRIPPFPTGSV